MELYRKHRPKTFHQIFGNEEVINSIKKYESIPHAILLTGPPGCGKTTLARIIAKKRLKCKGMDFQELDGATFRGIDTVRDIKKKAWYQPMEGRSRIWLMDEVHKLGVGGASEKNDAQNALLKTLESPPGWAYFILCTTNPEMLLPTIKSRCTHFEMKTLTDEEMELLLLKIAKKEGKEPPEGVLSFIIDISEGSPRGAVNRLESVLNHESEDWEQILKEDVLSKDGVKELCYALLDGEGWEKIRGILGGLKKSVPSETVRRGVLGMMESALTNGWGLKKPIDPWYIMAWFYDKNTYDNGFSGIVFCCRAISENIEAPY